MKNVKKREEKGNKPIDNFIAFGNKRKVFWSITIATIILSLIGITLIIISHNLVNSQPELINDRLFLRFFSILWILEAIYIALYLTTRNK